MVQRNKLDPLDEADDALAEMKRLGGEDDDEPTGQTHVTHVHLANPPIPSPSQPQIELSQQQPGVLTIAFTAVKQLNGWSLAFVVAAALAAYTFLKWSGKL